VLQCKTGQYNRGQYNAVTHITKVTHNTQGNNLCAKLRKINQERTLYTVKTQKRVKPEVDESVYGEVNSVEKHNYKIWLNDGVY